MKIFAQKKDFLRGFTLIEILVAISIVGILMGMALVSIEKTRAGGRDAKRKADLETIRSALELYKADCGQYPQALPTPGSPLTGCPNNTYLSSVPADPLPSSYSYVYKPGTYFYSYNLCAYLEQSTGQSTNCGFCGKSLCNYQTANP